MSEQNGRANIAELYQNGMYVTKISRRKGINPCKVYEVLKGAGINISSAIANRRLVAAERVRNGEDPKEVALDCRRSIFWIQSACADHDVDCRKEGGVFPIRVTTFHILAELQNTPRKVLQEIAQDHGLTRQRVGQILADGRKNGMLFPGRPNHPGNRPHCSMQTTETTK